jgi:transcriptional regulator with XRE-family HTH domain
MVRIKDLRTVHGLTMKQLAERMAEHGVEISEGGISNVENGNKKASDRLLIAWAKALGIEPLNIWHGPLRKPVEPGVPAKASDPAPQAGRRPAGKASAA